MLSAQMPSSPMSIFRWQRTSNSSSITLPAPSALTPLFALVEKSLRNSSEDGFIRYIPSLLGSMEPFQFYSCFISYSTKDEDFCKRLYSRLQHEHLRVWFAP